MQEQKEILIVKEHTFQLVDFVPFGYEIWNIGKNMPKGYLPLCRLSAYQPFPGGRNIEVDRLKAIKIKGAQLILHHPFPPVPPDFVRPQTGRRYCRCE